MLHRFLEELLDRDPVAAHEWGQAPTQGYACAGTES